jgi:hypothetical protein
VAYNGYVYNFDPTGGPYSGTPFNSLTSGKGYNHYFGSDHTYTLQGQLKTTDVNCPLDYTLTDPDQPTRYGLNLLGNPFSSGLDWDEITFGTYASNYPDNTGKVLHFRREGFEVYYVNGVGSAPGVTGIISPMQGFFIKTYTQGNTVTLPAGARTQNDMAARYKGSSDIPLVRIRLNSDGLNDYAVVRFDLNAKTGLDYDFDAEKTYLPSSYPYLYTLSEGTKFVINGQPFPEDKDTLKLPVIVNITKSGNHTLSATELQGLDNYNVTLFDKVTGSEVDLKKTPAISFSSSAGLISDRFLLLISNIGTGINDLIISKNIFNIYQAFDNINIQTIADEWDGKTGSIRVLDLTGRTISDNQNSEFWKNSLIQIPAPVTKGLYLVEIKSGVKRYVGKVVIR